MRDKALTVDKINDQENLRKNESHFNLYQQLKEYLSRSEDVLPRF